MTAPVEDDAQAADADPGSLYVLRRTRSHRREIVRADLDRDALALDLALDLDADRFGPWLN